MSLFVKLKHPERSALFEEIDLFGYVAAPEGYCATPTRHHGDILLAVHVPGDRWRHYA